MVQYMTHSYMSAASVVDANYRGLSYSHDVLCEHQLLE